MKRLPFGDNVREYAWVLKPVVFFWLVCVFAMTAVIRANVNYVDDYLRVLHGGRNWYDWGRYISEYASPFLHTSTRLQDISPLTMFVALFFCALAAVFMLYTIGENRNFSIGQILAVVPLALNPCFLQCLSYKYDAPYMALAVLFGFLPFLFRGTYAPKIAVVLCTMCMCMTHQAASCILPMMTVFLIMRRWQKGERAGALFRYGLTNAVCFFAGLVLFIPLLQLSSVQNPINFLPVGSLPAGWLRNMVQYYALLGAWYNRIWVLLGAGLVLAAGCAFVLESDRNKAASAVIFFAGVTCMALLAFGASAALQEPEYVPRHMYGAGILLAMMAGYLATREKALIGKGIALLITWCFVVYAFQYGNAMAEQKRYVDYRIELIIGDLIRTEVMQGDGKKYIQLEGRPGASGVIDKMHYGMTRELAVRESYEGVFFEVYFRGYFKLEEFANVATSQETKDLETDFRELDMPVLVDTPFHRICGEDAYILIELKT